MHRAYSRLEVKAATESGDERIITGVATTLSTDQFGDVVEPRGAQFKLPIPFLWQHDSHQPIGHVTRARPTKEGIEITARLASAADGPLKAKLDEAWQYIKLGLVRGLSIGFRAVEASHINETGGRHFTKWLWLELSAVTIPANAEATMTNIKSFASRQRAALGRELKGAATPPGVSGHHDTSQTRGNGKMNIKDRIAELEEERVSKAARMQTIVATSIEEGRDMDEDEQKEFDEINEAVKGIVDTVERLQALEKAMGTARPVQAKTAKEGAESRNPGRVKAPAPEPGVQFARFTRCMLLGKKTGHSPLEIAKQEYGNRDPHIVEMVASSFSLAMKGNVTAINTTTDAALIGNEGGFADYVTFLRNQMIVGKFGTNGIPALRRVPFYFPVVTQATGATASWVAEGKGKPLSRPTWARTELTPHVVAALTASSMQALRFSAPSAELALRDDLTAAVVAAVDEAFIDPTNDGTGKPAAINYNITGTAASTGNDADSVRADAHAAMKVFVDAKNALSSGVWVMSGSNALGLSTMVNAFSQAEFPGVTVNGGTFFGLPVIVSEAAGETVTLLNAGDVWLADDGGVRIDTSADASLQMVDEDSITQDSIGGGDPVETVVVSMFQTNSVAFRVEKMINWARRRAAGVATITGATWGAEAGS